MSSLALQEPNEQAELRDLHGVVVDIDSEEVVSKEAELVALHITGKDRPSR